MKQETRLKQETRRQFYIQKQIQGRLAIRCVVYWGCCLISVFLIMTVVSAFSQKLPSAGELFRQLLTQYSLVIIASLIVLPLVAWDMIKFSHRVVGPLIRLEREMQKLADGKSVRPLVFREDDFWHPLAAEFNSLRKRHIQLDHHACVNPANEAATPGEPVVLTRYPV